MKHDGAERVGVVVKTGSDLSASDLLDKERTEIEYGKAHFKALAVGEDPAEYVVPRISRT